MIKNNIFLKIYQVLSICIILTSCSLAVPSETMPLGASPLAVAVGIDTISVINSQKTLGDHITSMTTGKDCSTPRAYIDKGEYCRLRPVPPPKPPKVYCYRTLAAPVCYETKNPYGTDTLIANP